MQIKVSIDSDSTKKCTCLLYVFASHVVPAKWTVDGPLTIHAFFSWQQQTTKLPHKVNDKTSSSPRRFWIRRIPFSLRSLIALWASADCSPTLEKYTNPLVLRCRDQALTNSCHITFEHVIKTGVELWKNCFFKQGHRYRQDSNWRPPWGQSSFNWFFFSNRVLSTLWRN